MHQWLTATLIGTLVIHAITQLTDHKVTGQVLWEMVWFPATLLWTMGHRVEPDVVCCCSSSCHCI